MKFENHSGCSMLTHPWTSSTSFPSLLRIEGSSDREINIFDEWNKIKILLAKLTRTGG